MSTLDENEFHQAGSVLATEEDGYWQIAFADEPAHPTTYLICQNAFEYDDQDRQSGMDTHYVELNDQSQSAYGGVVQVTLWRGRIFFEFEKSTSKMFGLLDGLGLAFEITDENYEYLALIAKNIFGDKLRLAM